VPIAIRVNMLRWRVTMDCTPRTKKGQPPHSTTGAVRISWIQRRVPGPSRAAARGAATSAIASANTGMVRTRLTQKRRPMSVSSALGASSAAATSTGSRAMPHFGQLPGPTWRTS
jgi:hypothetical protein